MTSLPPSLLNLCYKFMERNILSQCQRMDIKDANCQTLVEENREYLSQLPSLIRSQLMENLLRKIAACGRKPAFGKNYPCSLYVVEVLFDVPMNELSLEFSYYKSMRFLNHVFNLVAKRGQYLEVLVLRTWECVKEAQVDYLVDCSVLESALRSAEKLSKLEFHNICTDDMLGVIGENCKVLNTLDVHGSRKVTDKGIGQLVINVKTTTDVDEAVRAEMAFKSMCHGSSNLWNLAGVPSPKVLRNSLPTVEKKKRLSEMWWNVPNLFPPLALRRTDPLEDKRNMKKTRYFYRVKSALCSTLKVVGLYFTSVTYVGTLCVLGTIDNLEFVDHNLTDFFHQMLTCWERTGNKRKGVPMPQLTLRNIFMVDAADSELKVVKEMCSELREFTSSSTRASILSLNSLPALNSLVFSKYWESRPDSDSAFAGYFTRKGQYLEKLKVHCSNNNINLYTVLCSCPHLREMQLDFMSIAWEQEDQSSTDDVLDNLPPTFLETVDLKRNVSETCLTNLLASSSHLRSISVQRIVGNSNNYLAQLCAINLSPFLKSFYVASPIFLFRDAEILKSFLSIHSQIRRIGKFSHVLESLNLGRTDLEIVNF